MGKKKNKTQVFVLKPWCWYCEREFEDEKVLLQHQKSKHFKCQLCPRKLNTAGGLMVHSQQVHKCEPEPLTNTLPGRDGYDIEIFGMEGIPSNAAQEWKARKEAEAGTAALQAAAMRNRPRVAYTVIPEADLQAALAQHKALMAKREPVEVKPPTPVPAAAPPAQVPNFMPPFPPPSVLSGPPPIMPPFSAPSGPRIPDGMPPFMPPGPGGMPMPPFPGAGPSPGPGSGLSPIPPVGAPTGPSGLGSASPATPVPTGPRSQGQAQEQRAEEDVKVEVLPPKDGVIWPDAEFTPAEKRAQQARYRYTSPTPEGGGARKRKAAADFI